MTTRLRLFGYHIAGALGFCGTLGVTAPDLLTPGLVGFAATYIPMVGLLLPFDWLAWVTVGRRQVRPRAHRVVTCVGAAALMAGLFYALGGPEAASAGGLCALVSFAPWWRIDGAVKSR